ncbi:hypothetical protein [Desulfoscipio gibsoniae]|nr:hypothetical protein [Desulfoscipio gibsoniae]
MIYGDKPVTIFATILALFAQLLFAGIMGIIFAYLIKLINSRDILFKGAIWGIGSSFILYAVPVIFKIADLTTTSVLTTFSHFIGTTLWGLVLAQVLHWLNDKPRIEV